VTILGVVAAAGESRRFGMSKALLVRTDGRTQVRAWAEQLRGRCDRVVVTVPTDAIVAGRIRSDLGGLNVQCVDNEFPHQQLWGSVHSALGRYRNASSVLVAPVDVPPVESVLSSLRLDGHDAAIPTVRGQRGHPVLLSVAWLQRPEVMAAAQQGGIEAALQLEGCHHTMVPSDDERVLHNHNQVDDAAVHVVRIDNPSLLQASHAVRRRVFIEEQQVSEAEELDDRDGDARHWLAVQGEWVVGTARWLWRSLPHPGNHAGSGVAKVQRVAVLAPWRRSGVGAAVMAAIEGDAHAHGARQLVLGAQLSALPFYLRLGYQPVGDVYLDANIEHRDMVKECSR
jgi:CTP:molybdopterin cytidylyltransferase MocA/predicted GNAT family N-acyltransferase